MAGTPQKNYFVGNKFNYKLEKQDGWEDNLQ